MPDVVPYRGTWVETVKAVDNINEVGVVPYRGTWVETGIITDNFILDSVVPYRGTWVETESQINSSSPLTSYLIEVRGLKLFSY